MYLVNVSIYKVQTHGRDPDRVSWEEHFDILKLLLGNGELKRKEVETENTFLYGSNVAEESNAAISVKTIQLIYKIWGFSFL
jgi:hypothetical protein